MKDKSECLIPQFSPIHSLRRERKNGYEINDVERREEVSARERGGKREKLEERNGGNVVRLPTRAPQQQAITDNIKIQTNNNNQNRAEQNRTEQNVSMRGDRCIKSS